MLALQPYLLVILLPLSLGGWFRGGFPAMRCDAGLWRDPGWAGVVVAGAPWTGVAPVGLEVISTKTGKAVPLVTGGRG